MPSPLFLPSHGSRHKRVHPGSVCWITRGDLLGSLSQLTPRGCLATAPRCSEPYLAFPEPGRTLINPAGWNKTLLIHLAQRCQIRMVSRNLPYRGFVLTLPVESRFSNHCCCRGERKERLCRCLYPTTLPKNTVLNPWGPQEEPVPAVPIPVDTATSCPLVKE